MRVRLLPLLNANTAARREQTSGEHFNAIKFNPLFAIIHLIIPIRSHECDANGNATNLNPHWLLHLARFYDQLK